MLEVCRQAVQYAAAVVGTKDSYIRATMSHNIVVAVDYKVVVAHLEPNNRWSRQLVRDSPTPKDLASQKEHKHLDLLPCSRMWDQYQLGLLQQQLLCWRFCLSDSLSVWVLHCRVAL